jgi:tetratricopeptide (TPR) repeat protein
MNTMKRFMLWLLLVLASPAWAVPSPKEVSDAVHAGNFVLAEQLLQQTLQDKPNSAMAHYELGQVLAKEKRHQDALTELTKAQQLDPALHFAKKPQLFQEIYNAEKAALQRQAFLQSNTRATSSSTVHPTKSEHQDSGGRSMISYFAVVLLLLGGVLLVIYWWMNRADAQRAKEQQRRLAAQAQEQLALLLQQAETVRDSELECRAANYSSTQKQQINSALATHREALMQAIAHCKEGTPLSDEQLLHLQA